MKIQFLGTGAAEGVPAVFCNCDYCKRIRELGESEVRTRSQVLIDGVLSVDFPPEAYVHSLRHGFNLTDLKYLLVTHSHMDHFYAHDFILRGYKYARVNVPQLQIYGNEEVLKVFSECTRREMKPTVAPNVVLHKISPCQVFTVGEYRVITVPAQHSDKEECILFYIERNGKGYLHLYDTGRIPERAFEFLAQNRAKANLVAIDCTFLEYTAGEKSRHMGIEDDMAMKEKLLKAGIIDNNTQIVITHFSHNGNPTRAHVNEVAQKYNVTAAYDGLEIDF